MTAIDSKDAGSALAAYLNGRGEERWEVKPASGSASVLLVPKSDPAKTVGLIVREMDASADPALTSAVAAVLAKHSKLTGVLTVRLKERPAAGDAKKLAADLGAALALIADTKPDAAGSRRPLVMPEGSGLGMATLAAGSEKLTVNAVLRAAAADVPKTEGAAEHGLVLVLADDASASFRLIEVSVPPGDSLPRRWWARREAAGWSFASF